MSGSTSNLSVDEQQVAAAKRKEDDAAAAAQAAAATAHRERRLSSLLWLSHARPWMRYGARECAAALAWEKASGASAGPSST
jgi:hypothetical protein